MISWYLIFAPFELFLFLYDLHLFSFALPLTSNNCRKSFEEELRSLVDSGQLSLARKKALEELTGGTAYDFGKCTRSDIQKIYVDQFQQSYDNGGQNYLNKIKFASASVKDNERIVKAKDDDQNCTTESYDWKFVDPIEIWDENCSVLPVEHTAKPKKESFRKLSAQNHCCDFTPESSWTYLRLPVIHEPAVRLRIPYRTDISTSSFVSLDLEQDGYLRPFDVAGILWPTGYLLCLCFADLNGCPIPEIQDLIAHYQNAFANNGSRLPFALELGSGIGASR